MTEPIDIEVKDGIDSSVQTKLSGIAKTARSGHRAVTDLQKALNSLDAKALSDLQRASNSHSSTLAKEALAQQRLADAAGKTAVADARAATEKQRLATETARTAAAESNAARAAAQSEAATLRLAQAQERAAARTSEQAREAQRLAATAASLKASVDPLASAMDRHNAELAQARMLYEQNIISQSELASYEATLKARIDATTQAIINQNAAQARGISTNKFAVQAGLNLSRQVADIGVTAAMGMNPLMILIQQGPQIADAFATAATQGLGFKEVIKQLLLGLGIIRTVNPAVAASNTALAASNIEVATSASTATIAEATLAGTTGAAALSAEAATLANAELAASNAAAAATSRAGAGAAAQLGTAARGASGATAGLAAAGGSAGVALAPLGIALVAIVAVIAAVTAGFGLFHRELSKGYPKDITDGLNLTAEQLERVKSRTVTFGDTVAATFTVLGRKIMSGPIGDALRWLGDMFSKGMDAIVQGAITGWSTVVGVAVGTYKTITQQWKNFPAVIADLFVSAVNKALDAIETLLNGTIKAIGALVSVVNPILARVGQEIIDTLGLTTEVSLPRLTNQWAGATEAMGTSWRENVETEIANTRAGMSGLGSEIAAEALRRARARAMDEAGDPNKGRSGGSGQSDAQKRADALADVNRELDNQLLLVGLIGDELQVESQFQNIVNSLAQKNIVLTDAEAVAIHDKIAALHDYQSVQSEMEKIYNDVYGAQQEYLRGVVAADMLFIQGKLSAQEYERVITQLTEQYRVAKDPMAEFNDRLAAETNLFGKFGVELRAATELQQLEHQLLLKGIKLTETEKQALLDKLILQERARMVNTELGAIYAQNQGAIEELAAKTEALNLAWQQGIIGAEQYRIGLNNIAMEAAQVAIRQNEMATAGQIALASLQSYMSSYQGMLPGVTTAFGNFFTTVADGFANSIARSIVYAEDFGSAMRDVAAQALTELIAALVKLGIQWVITQAIGNSLGATAAATSAAMGVATAAAWAPAAAMVSLATMGANAIPAGAALASTTALAQGLAMIPGMKDGGSVHGPGGPRGDKIPTMLSDGEFVVNARAARENRGLLEAINASDGRWVAPSRADGGPVSSAPSTTYRDPATVAGATNYGGVQMKFDFSNANFGGASPEELEDRFMQVVATQMVPSILGSARKQANEDMTTRFQRPKM